MAFKPRLTRPEAGNKYYIRKANGGYSNAIAGKPTDKDNNVLSNCVGYAYGRFNEIGNYGYCKYLAPVNAENFIQYKGSCKVGQTPKLGACMVWRKGATLSGSDGAGHVAIVEKVISDTEVVTSESAYGGSAFFTQTRKKGSNGRWGSGSAYTFLGFIYNPAVSDNETVTSSNTNTTKTKTKITSTVDRNPAKNQIKVLVEDLRVRTGPALATTILGFAKKGYYNFTETKSANGYTWYKIAEDQWVAYKPNWITVCKANTTKPTTTKPANNVDSARERDKSLSGTYKVVNAPSGLNIRAGAGLKNKSIGVLPNGEIVSNYGYYTVADGTKWLYIQTTKGVVGFCSSNYLRKM